MSFPWLTVLWLAPLAGALLVLAVPARARELGIGAALGVLGVSVAVAAQFDSGASGYQLVESQEWIPALGAGYTLGIDGIALVLVLLTTALVPILLLAGWHDGGRVYVALTLAVESMVLMSFLALDVLLFYIFFEAMLIPMYFLIGAFGSGGAGRAAVKFLLYNLFGGLLMLAAVVGVYVAAGTFSIRDIVAGGAADDSEWAKVMFLGFMFAFAVKAPLWPFHTWLPGAAVAAKPASAVLMMAVVDKVGTFGMLRYCLPMFPDASSYFAPLVVTLAVIAIVYGAVLAIAQTDVMRLIAYTSISHFGFIILGIFAMTSQGQAGATLYMVNHGVSTAALFLVAGFLVSRKGTRLIADYGGVQKVAPVLAGTFLVAGLATLSLPGLAPFVSEFLVLIGTYVKYPVAAVVATSALVLAAIYILWLYQRVFGGPPRAQIRDLGRREIAVVAPLLAVLIVLGVYPKPVLDVVTPAVRDTVSDPAPTLAGDK